jgi:hypothetical protein
MSERALASTEARIDLVKATPDEQQPAAVVIDLGGTGKALCTAATMFMPVKSRQKKARRETSRRALLGNTAY